MRQCFPGKTKEKSGEDRYKIWGYTGFERLWLFFAFSFFGWVLETVTAAVRQRRFVNRGLVNGPFCVLYGITGTAMLVVCRELHGIWLFLGSMIFSTLAEWIAGHVIERMYHERWWDYSHMKWNLDGYICVPVSIVWAFLVPLRCGGVHRSLCGYSGCSRGLRGI